jgi:c-di-GMP-binding flagellar brake protein YcgR
MAIDPKDLSIHDEVVVETEISGEPVCLTAFVTNVLAEELWLALRSPDARLAALTEGQKVHLTFDRGGTLIVESEFRRRLGNPARLGQEKSRVFAVRRPQGVESVQRRAHVRIDLERTVRIRALGTRGSDKMGNGKTVNIGAGGLQFTTDMPLLFGEQLRVALVLTSHEIVIAEGPIVRIDEVVQLGPDGRPETAPAKTENPAEPGTMMPKVLSRVAMRFDKIAAADQERISIHILAAHRQRKPAVVAPVESFQAAVPASSPAHAATAVPAVGAVDTQLEAPQPIA